MSTSQHSTQEINSLATSLAEPNDFDFLRGVFTGEERGVAAAESFGMAREENANKTERPSFLSDSYCERLGRCMVLDLALLILFCSLAVVYVVHFVWTDYYIPIMEGSQRTDEDLLHEYTYYERTCTAQDVTHGFTKSNFNTSTEEALDTLLMHGATIIPNLICPKSVANLRRYLQRRNREVAEEEKYPMSQGYQRLSYGVEPTEDEAIVQALSEITSNRLLAALLEEILGFDPALSEITTITSFFGAEDQVIHSDTKSEGYAAQFARSYLHSYSLFIPLQPVTTAMGVTQLCPGTHYCTNDMQEVCEEEMFGINKAYEDEVWKAGDGALMNQQVWHGGSKHVDLRGQERIIFILSFIARPQLSRDTRQLARGTYFHMKWNQWGHTWLDIAEDAAQSTAWPFNVLRSMAIWKPRRRNWGYDLLLSAALRASNRQSGMEAEDLESFIHFKMNGLFHFPKWLQGSFSYEGKNNPWQAYIQETLDNTLLFLQATGLILLVLYLVLTTVVTCTTGGGTSKSFRLPQVLCRLAITHGIIACLTWYTVEHIHSSGWFGESLVRPFLADSEFTSTRLDPTIPHGKSALPDRLDVLFGTRYDAPWLGSYNRWLNYHPGNQAFDAAIVERAYLYPMYNDAASDFLFLRFLIADILDEVAETTHGGRVLQQDHLSGAWVVLALAEVEDLVRISLAIESTVIAKEVDTELRYLIAQYRFGKFRGTALALESTLYLLKLQRQLLQASQPLFTPQKGASHSTPAHWNTDLPTIAFKFNLSLKVLKPKVTLPTAPTRPVASPETNRGPTVGTCVMVFQSLDKSWDKGIVVDVVQSGQTFDVAFPNGSLEEDVSIGRIRKTAHVQAGAQVRAYLEEDTVHGTLDNVYPNGNVDIALDDGGLIRDVYPDDYDIHYPIF